MSKSTSYRALAIVSLLLGALLASVIAAHAIPSAKAASGTNSAVQSRAYPLPPKSSSSQITARARLRLPKIKQWATRIIGKSMDQPNGLMDTQVVSALHIRRAFRKSLGKSAWRSAIRISWRESRLLPHMVNNKNTNTTNDWGLFQLNDGGTLQYGGLGPNANALHPRKNARAARYIVMNTGWWPWGGKLCKNSVPCPNQ